MCARGGLRVDLAWREGKIIWMQLQHQGGEAISIVGPGLGELTPDAENGVLPALRIRDTKDSADPNQLWLPGSDQPYVVVLSPEA